MKRIILTLITIHLSLFTLHAQSWMWVREEINDSASSSADAVGDATDAAGNIYEFADYGNRCSFPPYSIYAPSGGIYIVKYNSVGNVIWAKSSVGTINTGAGAGAITTDAASNIFITGIFIDTIAFGTYNLFEATLGYGMFLVKYDSGGNVIWAKNPSLSGIHSLANPSAIATDALGNVYVTGMFYDTISFGSYKLEANGWNIFLVEYDASGNVKWALSPTLASSVSNAYTTVLATDKLNNLYMAGAFTDTISFGTTHFYNGGRGNDFLIKFNSSGTIQWSMDAILPHPTSYIYTSRSGSGNGLALAVKSSGNILMASTYTDTVQFGTFLLSDSLKYNNIFITEINPSGNMVWAKKSVNHQNGSGDLLVNSISVDKNDQFYMCGSFDDTIGFGSVILNDSNTILASFLIKFDSSGNAICGADANNKNDDNNWIVADPLGDDAYFTGDVSGYSCIFGKDTLKSKYPNEWGFLAKWTCNEVTNIGELKVDSEEVKLFPNPNSGTFSIETKNEELRSKSTIEVYNMLGERIYTNTFNIQNSTFKINLSGQPNGVYLYRVIDESGAMIGFGKFIINK